jgi:hypothetical protein
MSNPVIDEFETKIWYNDKRVFHRIDGPALEWKKGTKQWYINGSFVFTLWTDGVTQKGNMTNIPDGIKQSIIEHILKLHI